MHVTEIQQVDKSVILIVDDQKTQRELLVKYLTNWFNNKYVLAEAQNGQEALEFFRKNHRSIKLITMNIQMPILNGIEAIAKIREWEFWREGKHPPFVPIVVISATLEHHRTKLEEVRYDAGVQLPYDSNWLQGIVLGLLNPPPRH